MSQAALVADIIAVAGGWINTETRFRMVPYLLDQKEMQNHANWHYGIPHHGPYSHDFKQGLAKAILAGLVEKNLETPPARRRSLCRFQEKDPHGKPVLDAGKARSRKIGTSKRPPGFSATSLCYPPRLNPEAHPLTSPPEILMPLIPKAQRARMLANDQNLPNNADPVPVIKLFARDMAAIWLLTEIDANDPDRAFGLYDDGHGVHLGYVSLGTLAAIKDRSGLPIERDHSFRSQFTLSVYIAAAQITGAITTQETVLKHIAGNKAENWV